MHDANAICENPDFYKANFKKRGEDITSVDKVFTLNEMRKELLQKVESLRAEVKSLSKQIGPLKQKGEDASELMEQVASAKAKIEEEESLLDKTLSDLKSVLERLPNVIDEEVPLGKSEDDNVEVKKWGEIPRFDFDVLDHVDLGEKLGMLDFEAGAKLTGSRFYVCKGALARLERALINFMLDENTKEGYEEILPPYIVNQDTLYGTGQLPKFEEDLFKLDDTDWYLIPTAEVPLTNLKKKELFSQDELPLKYTAYTPCFRSEAGSYGRDTRGLIRVHQFSKVELVNIVKAQDSEQAHKDMVARAENILEKLGLPYRTMLLCSADIGFGAAKCYDLEVWLPSQNKYREISSISNCRDFQGRRAGIRYRDAEGKPQFAHTLNGSGLAVGRTLLAIMENYQQADGSIKLPEVLVPYMGMETIKKS